MSQPMTSSRVRVIGHVELLGVVGPRLFPVAAHARAAAAGDLRDAQLKRRRAHRLRLAGGDDHTRIGHGDADECDDLLEHLVGNAVVESVGVDVARRLHPRHRDGVRAHAEHRFQMLRVHEQAGELVGVALQAEQHAEPHVVDAGGHGAVVGLGVPGVVGLGARGVQLLVAGAVVGLLEQDVGADLRGLQLVVGVLGRGGDVHIHAADGPVFVLGAVDGLKTLQNVVKRVVDRIFPRLDGQALVAHVLQGDDLGADLFLRELATRDVAVLRVVGAVQAPVHAVVRKVQRREQHDTVAVVGLLDVAGQPADLGVHLPGPRRPAAPRPRDG